MKITRVLFQITALLIISLSVNADANESTQNNFEALIESIQADDHLEFRKLLVEGADPNYIGLDERSPDNWINCLVARKSSKLWLQTFKEFGGDLNYIRDEYAANRGLAKYASALYCSILNRSMDPFVYLVGVTDNSTIPLCHLCAKPKYFRTLLEYCIRWNQFDKASWLLENTEFAKNMINQSVIRKMNLRGSATRKDQLHMYWKTVDLIESHGYKLNPNIERE